jgi:gephyrin
MDGSLTAAILIVSTTAAQVPSSDASASALRDVFQNDGAGKWKEPVVEVVTDDAIQIQRQLMAWTDGPNPVNFIVTTGGTGFAIADVTPEVPF